MNERTPHITLFLEAKTQPAPGEWLFAQATSLAMGGVSQENVRRLFEEMRILAIDEGNQKLEDDILDVLDAIEGWCAPHRQLYCREHEGNSEEK